MTTLRQIVIDAMRDGGLIEVGTAPEGNEFAEAFTRLQVLLKSLVGNELGDRLTSVNYGVYGLTEPTAISSDQSPRIDASYIPMNTRVVLNVNAPKTLHFPPAPRDGAMISVIDNAGTLGTSAITLDGNGRHIEASSTVVLNTAGAARDWFYRDDLANWVRLTDLTYDDNTPFPMEYDDLLVLMLAIRINPRYGLQTAPETQANLVRMKTQFKARYKPVIEVASEPGLTRLPSKTTVGFSTAAFNHGWNDGL